MLDISVENLISLVGEENVFLNEPMSNHTSFKIGGQADVLVIVKNNQALKSVLELAVKSGIAYTMIGFGSNLLVADKGIRGLVIVAKTNEYSFSYSEGDKASAWVDASVPLASFAKQAARAGFKGTEFASGIPGSIGGAVAMNAGAYGGEIKDILKGCEVFDPADSKVKYLTCEELELSYRSSLVLKKKLIVLRAEFALEKGDAEESLKTISELNTRRRDKQPLEYPSAGSTFKRPEGYFAGRLIEEAGLRGVSVGDAQVSEKHCGFVVNRGNASAADVLELIHYVQDRVYDKFGVKLEPEVRMLGEF